MSRRRKPVYYVVAFSPEGMDEMRLLGPLETEVMDEVWRRHTGSTTIRSVWEPLARRRPIAFTTVMTIMNRLAEKGLLVRRGHARAYRYAPRESRDAFMARVSKSVAEGMIKDFREYAVSQFVAALERADPRKLDELRRVVNAHRRSRE
jgi:predicted transcriptional regulator